MVTFDDILFEINDFGKYQKIRYLLICLAGMLPAIVTYLHSFTAAKPAFRCANPYIENDLFTNNNTYENLLFDKCFIQSNSTKEACTKWVFDKTFYETTLTEDVCSFISLFFKCFCSFLAFSGQ